MFVIILGAVLTAFMLFANYKAWFGDWGKEHYGMAKKYWFTPFFLITLLGERFYIIFYRIGAVVALLVSILWFIMGLTM